MSLQEKIAELREKLHANLDAMEVVVKAVAGREPTEAEAASLDVCRKADDDLKRQLVVLEDLSRRKAANATPVDQPSALGSPAIPKNTEDQRLIGKRLIPAIVRGLMAGGGSAAEAIEHSRKSLGEGDVVVKVMQQSISGSGGFLVQEAYATEVVELLRPMAVVRRNARAIPMPAGNLTLPRIGAGSQSYYAGESQPATQSDIRGDQIKLVAKKQLTMVPISNDLRRFASEKLDGMVLEDIAASMATREDLAFIRNDGTDATPTGIRYQALAANVFAANATVNVANVKADLNRMRGKLAAQNSRFLKARWLFSPRVRDFLELLADNGATVFASVGDKGTLLGFPIETTTQIPDNLGGGGTESEMYLADFADAIIGDVGTMEIEISGQAALVSGSDVRSMFDRDESAIRVVTHHDFALRHRGNATVMTGVTWGA